MGEKIVDSTITLVCQINGKVRDKLVVIRDSTQEDVELLVNKSEKLKTYFNQGTLRKTIYIKNKLINFVVK